METFRQDLCIGFVLDVNTRLKMQTIRSKVENRKYRLFGWDNNDERFKVYFDGEDGCIHRKATIET